MHFTSFLLAAATAVCLGPSFASAECTQFRNGRVCSAPFRNICGGMGTATLTCCTGVGDADCQ
ncbi:hypothetical protein CGMCC3_g15409 [Colletotrichum fructicola]|nr:uncharacterized protein CGMCC3_g15409 [Colletotrichum fructicola]KAE9568480.1 hypothetical protein CGMCC3_g15409 [Colletotrichum fructicola]